MNEQLGINFSRSLPLPPFLQHLFVTSFVVWKLIVTEEGRTFRLLREIIIIIIGTVSLLARESFECCCCCLANKLAIGPFEVNQVTKC